MAGQMLKEYHSTKQCAELKEDIIRKICELLSCRLDRNRMAAAYESWKKAITKDGDAMLRTLPVLYVPRSISPSFACLSCKSGCHIEVPPEVLDYRCFGSHDCGWLFLAKNHFEDHVMWDSVTGQEIKIPDRMCLAEGAIQEQVIIRAATVSGTPSVTVPIEQCVGAALVDRQVPDLAPGVEKIPDVMFWSLNGAIGWGTQNFLLDLVKEAAADVIFFNGAFHFLSIFEGMIAAKPSFGLHGLELTDR